MVSLMRPVKNAVDSHGVLNPGVLFGDPGASLGSPAAHGMVGKGSEWHIALTGRGPRKAC